MAEPSKQFDPSKYPKSRVELHLHLEGAVRKKTIYELGLAKNYRITGGSDGQTNPNTLAEIDEALMIHKPINLNYFIAKINLYMPLLVGDLSTIERIAYELCEDQSKQHVIYFEARYSPHFLSNTVPHFFNETPLPKTDPKAVTPKDAILAVERGFKRGSAQFDIKVKHILCTITNLDGWATDVVNLAEELGPIANVVAIDIAGNEFSYTDEETAAFHRAKKLGIHRTVHSGEMGPPANVKKAVEQLFAERIGHGYHVVQDSDIYQMCRNNNIHFETCPYSSYFTGAVKPEDGKHPIVRFAEDNVNFSISKDDPTITNSTLDTEYQLLQLKGLNEVHLIRANLNAARSSFLTEEEKKQLLNRLYKVYGLVRVTKESNGHHQ